MNYSPFLPCPAAGRSGWLHLILVALGCASFLSNRLAAQTANLPPKVALVQPASGTTYSDPAGVEILVEAADADGSIRSVEVLTDAGSLGSLTPDPAAASPIHVFRWTWRSPSGGEHKLMARATDNEGATAFSESVLIYVKRDDAPTGAQLSFRKPAHGAVVPATDNVSMEVVAVDPNGDIRHVQFFANGLLIGQSDHWTKEAVIPGRPREHFLDWQPPAAGRYRLLASAVDTQGKRVESEPVLISAGASVPLVSIYTSHPETSEPASNIRVRPGVITIKRDGALTTALTVSVDYSGSALPGVDYERLPETVIMPAGAAEAHLLVAALEDSVAEDPETVVATLVNTQLERAPEYAVDPENSIAKVLIHDSTAASRAKLELTQPTDGAVFPPGEAIIVEATAVDPEGYIARVEFFDFERLIGVSEINFIRAPDPGTPIHHTVEWQNPPAGDHRLTARAMDSRGALVVSNPVRFRVGPLQSRPVVQVVSLDSEATEFPPFADAINPARFSITREGGDLSQDLYVAFSLHGTAEPGQDYPVPDRKLRIPAGEREVVVDIIPISDDVAEPMETVVLSLEDPMPISSFSVPPAPYEISPFHGEAVAVIFDGRQPENGALELALPSDGAVHSDLQIIPLLAAAFHPSSDLTRVDFYANERLIGSSEMVFFRADIGGLIVHRFDWLNPTPGEHILTARAVVPGSGEVLLSGKIRVRVQSSGLQPVVLEITAIDPFAAEVGPDRSPDPATFAIRRVSGPKDVSTTVYYEVDGTASNGVDYTELPGKVTLPAGEDFVTLVVTPVLDRGLEGDETVIVKLVPPVCPALYPPPPFCYQIAGAGAARAVIRDYGLNAGDPPVVRILTPQNGSVFGAGETIEIATAATDSNGILKLELLAGERLLESGNTAKLVFNSTGFPPGQHTLIARVVDSNGVEVRSTPVKILVIDRAGGTIAPNDGSATARFNSIANEPDGRVRLQLAGPADRVCLLEVSSDLVNWTEIGPVFLPDGEIAFETDRDSRERKQRFYRVRLP